MTRNIKYTTAKVFYCQGSNNKALFEQIRNYIHFSATTFRSSKGVKIPSTAILQSQLNLRNF